jgi:hypothetical protein
MSGLGGGLAVALQHKPPDKPKNTRLSAWYTSLRCTKRGTAAALLSVVIRQQVYEKVFFGTVTLQEVVIVNLRNSDPNRDVLPIGFAQIPGTEFRTA